MNKTQSIQRDIKEEQKKPYLCFLGSRERENQCQREIETVNSGLGILSEAFGVAFFLGIRKPKAFWETKSMGTALPLFSLCFKLIEFVPIEQFLEFCFGFSVSLPSRLLIVTFLIHSSCFFPLFTPIVT